MSTSIAALHAFLFTDIEGSSLRWLNHRAAMELAVARHDEIIREVVSAHAGEIFKASGDAFYAAFARPADAVNAAVAAQRILQLEDFSAVEGLKVRMAVHVGSAERRGNDFFGPALNRTARLLELAHGGQILVTSSLPELLAAEREVDATFVRVGTNPLDDPAQPVGIFQVMAKALPGEFPPLRTAKTRLAVVDSSPTAPRSSAARVATLIAVGLGVAAVATAPLWRKTAPAVPTTPAVSEKSIAVLPFDNLSEEKENAFFANGMQDEILTDLSRIADLKVISRSSVMQYKSGAPRNLREIAPALGVIYILEGSVQRAGGKVRVTAQLIDSRTDAHVWAERYDRDLADVFGIQSEIAERIAAQLKARLSDTEKAALAEVPTRDLVAYDLYLQAQQSTQSGHKTRQAAADAEQTIRWLDEAVTRDPGFFAAWCALAERHDISYFSGRDRTPNRLALAQAAVDAAVGLRPDAGETHLTLAQHYYWGFRDYERARQELALARRSLPNNANLLFLTALIDRRQGRWEDSNLNFERGLELDPRNLEMLVELGPASYARQRRYADAARTMNRVKALRPGVPEADLMLVELEFCRTANLAPALALLDSLAAGPMANRVSVVENVFEFALLTRDAEAAGRALAILSGDENKPVMSAGYWFPRGYFAGRIARMRNDSIGARAAFAAARIEAATMVAQQPDNAKSLMVLALVDSELERTEEALREARKACELLPLEKDALFGADLVVERAKIEARAGETEAALEHLRLLTDIPSVVNYGDLRMMESWDPLRGNPRFQALVEKLAPIGAKP